MAKVTSGQGGKGDRPRKLGPAFNDNFDKIDWGSKCTSARKLPKLEVCGHCCKYKDPQHVTEMGTPKSMKLCYDCLVGKLQNMVDRQAADFLAEMAPKLTD